MMKNSHLLQEGTPDTINPTPKPKVEKVNKIKKTVRETDASAPSGNGFGSVVLSEALQAVLGSEVLPRSMVTKQIWVYIKEHELQDPNDKRCILADAKLKVVFGTKRVTMFEMNRLLAAHMTPAAVERVTTAGGGSKSKTKKRAEREDEEESSSSSKRTNNFGMVSVSSELESVIGVRVIGRSLVTKKLWEYIKEHELQDPEDKRCILADAKLKAVFKEDRVSMFKISGLLAPHMTKHDE